METARVAGDQCLRGGGGTYTTNGTGLVSQCKTLTCPVRTSNKIAPRLHQSAAGVGSTNPWSSTCKEMKQKYCPEPCHTTNCHYESLHSFTKIHAHSSMEEWSWMWIQFVTRFVTCDQICNLWPDLPILGTVQILSFNYCHVLRDMHLCSSAIIQKTSRDCKCDVLHPITPCSPKTSIPCHCYSNTSSIIHPCLI